MTRWLRTKLWRIPALLIPPRRCPQCNSKKIDPMPRGTASGLLLETFALHLYECHDCSFAYLTWRNRNKWR